MRELSGIGKNRQRSLAALGAQTFGHVAKLPSPLLQQKFGIWGTQLWLFANGLWNEPLLLEVKDRTTISSNTTLPYDEPDYEAALTFTLSEATRLIGQLRREQLQARELGLTIRFNDFSEVSGGAPVSTSRNFRIQSSTRCWRNIFREHHGRTGQACAANPHCDLESGAAGHAADAVGHAPTRNAGARSTTRRTCSTRSLARWR